MLDLEYGGWAIDFNAERHVCNKVAVMKPQGEDGGSWTVDLPAITRCERTSSAATTELRELKLHDVEKKSDSRKGFSFISERKLLSEGFTASWDENNSNVEYKDQEGNVRLLAFRDWHLFGWEQVGMRVRVAPVRLRQRQGTA